VSLFLRISLTGDESQALREARIAADKERRIEVLLDQSSY
jgi:hypothetical protein